jgi:hypothetical protein
LEEHVATGGAASRQANAATVALEAERCFELKAKGWSVRRIAAELGMSYATVQRRITVECERRVSPRVEDYRKLQDETLDVAQARVQAIIDEAADAELVLKAVDRLGRLLDRRARLHGLDAPTKVDATVVQQTQAEAELEALFAAQDAVNAATRAVIEGH